MSLPVQRRPRHARGSAWLIPAFAVAAAILIADLPAEAQAPAPLSAPARSGAVPVPANVPKSAPAATPAPPPAPAPGDPAATADDEETKVRPLLRGDILGEMHEYWTWSPTEDMLDIARGDELGLIELMVANPGVDPWLPSRNVRLILPTMHILPDAPRTGIVINTAEMRLYYFDSEVGPVSFPLGVGRDGYLTPIGSTTIVRKKEGPSWYLTPSEIRDHPELPKVIPPGPDNPLGAYALYLGWPTYLIHGTNTEWGIGRRTSRGCIRMYPEDIEWLFQKAPIGTKVTVVDQAVKLGWRDGELYLEVNPSTMQVDAIEETSRAPGPDDPIPLAQESDRILRTAGEQAPRLNWPAIEDALAKRQGYPIRITNPGEQATVVPPPGAISPGLAVPSLVPSAAQARTP